MKPWRKLSIQMKILNIHDLDVWLFSLALSLREFLCARLNKRAVFFYFTFAILDSKWKMLWYQYVLLQIWKKKKLLFCVYFILFCASLLSIFNFPENQYKFFLQFTERKNVYMKHIVVIYNEHLNYYKFTISSFKSMFIYRKLFYSVRKFYVYYWVHFTQLNILKKIYNASITALILGASLKSAFLFLFFSCTYCMH